MEHSQTSHILFTNQSKPTCFSKDANLIAIGQQNEKILLIDEHTLKKHSSIITENKDRTLCLRLKDNILVRGGNEGIVNLWDIRQNPISSLHSFNKNGCKIRALDLSQHILAGGSSKRMVFWDLRKMKQRCEFTQSFNDQITGIQFSKQLPTVFHACAMDGLIARFDLSQQNQQDAFAWGHQIIESPCKLQLSGNTTLIQTDNQVLLTLYEQSLKDRYQINSIENPTHILHSYLGEENRIHYYTKNMKNNSVQFWIANYHIGYVPLKMDVQMLIPLGQQKVLLSDSMGNWHFSPVVRGNTAPHKTHQNQNFMTVQELEAREGKKVQIQPVCNNNGFIISKPSTLKNHSKKFKPY